MRVDLNLLRAKLGDVAAARVALPPDTGPAPVERRLFADLDPKPAPVTGATEPSQFDAARRSSPITPGCI